MSTTSRPQLCRHKREVQQGGGYPAGQRSGRRHSSKHPGHRGADHKRHGLVGETLMADVSRIDDEDGISSATFIYQWIRTDGGADAEIPDAVNSIYTVTEGDVGKPIKVRVTFTDDAGNEESLTSAAVVAAVTRSDDCPRPPAFQVFPPRARERSRFPGGRPRTTAGRLSPGTCCSGRKPPAAGDRGRCIGGDSHRDDPHHHWTDRRSGICGTGHRHQRSRQQPCLRRGIRHARDTTPPQLSTATVDGTTLTLTYDEALAEDPVPGTDTFTVMAGSNERGVVRVSMAGATVILTLDSAVMAGMRLPSAIPPRPMNPRHALQMRRAITGHLSTGRL